LCGFGSIETVPKVIEWIHPSVRDVAIEYLMAHDRDRQRFLRMATPSGFILAVSSAGGASGERTLPLAITRADWEALSARAREILSAESSATQLGLLQALLVALQESKGAPKEIREHLEALGTQALGSVYARWEPAGVEVAPPLLGTYYELSVAVRQLAPSPSLERVWQTLARRGLAAVRAGLIDEQAVIRLGAWIEFAVLLAANEPRFLRIAHFPRDQTESLSEAVDLLEARVEDLSTLDFDEDDWVSLDDGRDVEAPVEPSYEESTELDWLEAALALMKDLSEVMTEAAMRLGAMEDAAVNHIETRRYRKERYEEWEAGLKEGPEDDVRDPDELPRFDLNTFFSDL
jgi:hypothetical protein